MEELELKMFFGIHAEEEGIIKALDFILEDSDEVEKKHIKAAKKLYKRDWKFKKQCEDIAMVLGVISWTLELNCLTKERKEVLPRLLEELKKQVAAMEELINE